MVMKNFKGSILVILAVVVLSTFLLVSTKPGHDAVKGPVVSTLTPKTAVLSESSKRSDYQLTIAKVTKDGVNSSAQTKRFTVSPVILNLSDKTIQLSPGLQMFLNDKNNVRYSMTARYLAAGKVVGGPLAGHTSTRLDVDFEIPISSTPKQFIFQVDGGSAPTTVEL